MNYSIIFNEILMDELNKVNKCHLKVYVIKLSKNTYSYNSVHLKAIL
jgi:hypothetical protein